MHNYILYYGEPSDIGIFPVYLRMALIFTDFQKCTWLSPLPAGKSVNRNYWSSCRVLIDSKEMIWFFCFINSHVFKIFWFPHMIFGTFLWLILWVSELYHHCDGCLLMEFDILTSKSNWGNRVPLTYFHTQHWLRVQIHLILLSLFLFK